MIWLRRLRAWRRRYLGPRRGRHTHQAAAELVLTYLSDVDFWRTP